MTTVGKPIVRLIRDLNVQFACLYAQGNLQIRMQLISAEKLTGYWQATDVLVAARRNAECDV